MNTESIKKSQPITTSITEGDLTWTDIMSPSSTEVDGLAEKFHFHPLALEDSLSHTQLSKVDDYGTYLFLALHFPVITEGDRLIKSTWLSVFIGENYIITLHGDKLKTLTDLFEECRTNEETRQTYFADGSGYLLYRIIDALIEYCYPVLDRIMNLLDDIEERVYDETHDDSRSIATLRRDIITLRRIVWPWRSVITELRTRIRPFTKEDLGLYFDNLLDQVNKIWENLEEAKEVVEVYKDTDYVLVTNRINRIVQTLTTISAVLLPFLVVSSLYGMNVDLPGGIIVRGGFASFGILLAIMFIISGGMLYFMRRRHWI
jgi:magnesium transporter